MYEPARRFVGTLLAVGLASASCGGSAETTVGTAASTPTGEGATDTAPPVDDEAGVPAPSDASTPPVDAAPDPADGTPTRRVCTSTFGHALTTTHGRLDGYLVSIVPAQEHACSGDPSHVHLQVLVNGAVYDVAVNVDGYEGETDARLPGDAWQEGWHPSAPLDYVRDFELHASALSLTSPPTIRSRLETLLASTNHISVFATAYGPSGAHLVHRNGTDNDGALVIHPLAPRAHIIAFRFSQDTF